MTVSVGDYFIICPVCYRKIVVPQTPVESRINVTCKCEVQLCIERTNDPLTEDDVKKAMNQLKEAEKIWQDS